CRHVHAICTKRSLPDKQGSLWRGATGQRKAFSIASHCSARQAYGRAGVALLTQRMLLHPSDPTLRLTLMTNRPTSREGARPQVEVTEVSSFCSSCTPMASAGPAASHVQPRRLS